MFPFLGNSISPRVDFGVLGPAAFGLAGARETRLFPRVFFVFLGFLLTRSSLVRTPQRGRDR